MFSATDMSSSASVASDVISERSCCSLADSRAERFRSSSRRLWISTLSSVRRSLRFFSLVGNHGLGSGPLLLGGSLHLGARGGGGGGGNRRGHGRRGGTRTWAGTGRSVFLESAKHGSFPLVQALAISAALFRSYRDFASFCSSLRERVLSGTFSNWQAMIVGLGDLVRRHRAAGLRY